MKPNVLFSCLLTVYLQGYLPPKRCIVCGLTSRQPNPYIKLELIELGIQSTQKTCLRFAIFNCSKTLQHFQNRIKNMWSDCTKITLGDKIFCNTQFTDIEINNLQTLFCCYMLNSSYYSNFGGIEQLFPFEL